MSLVRHALTALAHATGAAMAIYEIVRIVALWNGSLAWVAQSLGPDWNMTYLVIPSSAIEDLAYHVGDVLDVLGHSSGDEPVLAESKAMRQAIVDGFSSLRSDLERS